MSTKWTIPAGEWSGETAFIIGGGTSVAYQRTARLNGRKVIVINSSYETFFLADYLFFGDKRWHDDHKAKPQFNAFGGKRVTVSGPAEGPNLFKLDRITPDPKKPNTGFCATGRGLASQATSMQGAINLAAMLGATRIILLGLDGTRGPSGLTHHHYPHRWNNKPGDQTWIKQEDQLRLIVPHLHARGIEVFNVSPITKFQCFPVADLETFI